MPVQTTEVISVVSNASPLELCPHFEFHILLLQLVLLSVSAFMHLYFLLKAAIMIFSVSIYLFHSSYSNVFTLVAENYGLNSGALFIGAMLEAIFFMFLLICLDRRVKIDDRTKIL